MKRSEHIQKSKAMNSGSTRSRKLNDTIKVKSNGGIKDIRFRRSAVAASRAKAAGKKAKNSADSTLNTDEYRNENQYATDNVMEMGRDTVRGTKNAVLGSRRNTRHGSEHRTPESQAKEFIKSRFEQKTKEGKRTIEFGLRDNDLMRSQNVTSSWKAESLKSNHSTSRHADVMVGSQKSDLIRVRGRETSAISVRGRSESPVLKVREPSKAFIKTRGASQVTTGVEATASKETVRVFSSRVTDAGARMPKVVGQAKAHAQTNQVKKIEAVRRSQLRVGKAAEKTAAKTKDAAVNTYRALKKAVAGTKALIMSLSTGGTIALIIVLICTMFGGAFYFFGDTSSKSYTPVSAEVQAYTSLITKYAKVHDIPEYVELIKAVMMQESGGRGLDPMQCAESGYNTKYPNMPNGITDPEYSIDIGVKTLANSLKVAGVENPVDMDRIRLALQGYNYGNGYISWAKARDGGYTVENAIAFSDEQAKKMGWSSYGDKQYVSHVLRYYPFGNYNYGVGNQAIVNIALDQQGNPGGAKFWSWYGFNGRVEWCACFVSWCADQLGYIDAGVIPKFAGVGTGIDFFKERGQWQSPGYVPAPGDIIFFDWEADGLCDHVGIVESCDGTTVYTIEGNTSDICARRQYGVNSIHIYGYGVPKY